MPLVEVRHLVKEFAGRQGLRRRGAPVRAVDDVSFSIEEGETFGLVGESGSGKTTTGRCILRLIEPTSGEVRFRDRNLLELSARQMRRARREMQIVFQDPYSSQRQRIGLARALALEPSLVIADEPVSALDVSVQAQVVNLLMELQQRLKLTYLFIAHDLRLVRHICSRVAVMYRGKIVELAPTDAVFAAPRHPYTRALLSAIPVLDPDAPRQRIVLDEAEVDRRLPLREVAAGHWAAV